MVSQLLDSMNYYLVVSASSASNRVDADLLDDRWRKRGGKDEQKIVETVYTYFLVFYQEWDGRKVLTQIRKQNLVSLLFVVVDSCL